MVLNNGGVFKIIKFYSATAEQKLPRTLCSTVSLFHVTSSQDLTWIIWSLIFSSILIREVLEGAKFIFLFITLLFVSASSGWCDTGCGFILLISPKDRCVTVTCMLAGFWVPVQELRFGIFVLVFSPPSMCHTDPERQRSKIWGLAGKQESMYWHFLRSCGESFLEWFLLVLMRDKLKLWGLWRVGVRYWLSSKIDRNSSIAFTRAESLSWSKELSLTQVSLFLVPKFLSFLQNQIPLRLKDALFSHFSSVRQ